MSQSNTELRHEPVLCLQVGGTLIPGRHIYIPRAEDEQLFQLLRTGEYVNILSSRQVGKSSLMLRTAFRLREELDYRFAVIDLTSLGTPNTALAYFRGLVGELVLQLKLPLDPESFWREDGSGGTCTQQFIRFFREVVATATNLPTVIFLDEIDSTLKLPFTDDLFTALRSMYNERALVPEYQHLTFCLVGVATPDELIKDRRTTPYNVGKTMWLGDFDAARDHLGPLVEVLSDDPELGRTLLDRVLYWTAGHPFLTNRLCQDLRGEGVTTSKAVDRFVTEHYATLDRLGDDVHIQQILRFVGERLSDGLASFDLYERILKGRKERDQPSLAHAELKLSGLVRRGGDGLLTPRNRIYRRLFDRRWVSMTRPQQPVRRYRRYSVATSALLLVTLATVLTYYQTSVVPLQTLDEARKALEDQQVTLTTDRVYGWTKIGLPGQGNLESLRQVLPSLARLNRSSESRGFALDVAFSDLSNEDLALIAEVPGLRALQLAGNPAITDVGPLKALSALENLDLSGTQVTGLSPIASLSQLRSLDVSNTPVSDLVPLSTLTNLEELNLSFTRVKELAPISGLKGLRVLGLDGLGIHNFGSDGRLPELKVWQDPVNAKPGAPGATFRDCPECPQMVVVPAGSFVMGSPAGELGRLGDEGPQHTVRIAQPFAIGKFEVRFDEWLSCVQAGACRAASDSGWGRGIRPAIHVSWDDAVSYAKWLSAKTGKRYRLPTEAEWEYAARAGTSGAHFWDDQSANACRFASVYEARGKATFGYSWEAFVCDDGFPATAPVGTFQPNRFGLHDMLGNVWEWVQDCYHASYEGVPSDGSVWQEDPECKVGRRVIRGGSWSIEPVNLRSANRSWNFPDLRYNFLGFRLAQDLP